MRARVTFFIVTFAFSWSVALLLYVLAPANPLARTGLLAVFMFGPALGALAARRIDKRPLAALVPPLRVPGSARWWLLAWLSPLVIAFIALLVGACMPGAELVFSSTSVLDRVAAAIPPEQLAEARAKLDAIPPAALLALQVVQALIAGVSINMVAAFGEELGWRGFLHAHWKDSLSLWPRALVVGGVWGAWHAPIILQGHNYPQHPVAGVAMMIVFCVLLAPWFEEIRERTGSVVAASVLHGTINASAGFAILYLRGGSDLVVGLTGLAGFLVLALANVALALVRRRHRSTPSRV